MSASAPARGADGRIARVHLRGGMLALARAELEQMAGIGILDREALADLAEVRWRNGDLVGAAQAAAAHRGAGGDEPVVAIVLGLAAGRAGHPGEAMREADGVAARVGEGVDPLFAGEARDPAWAAEAAGWMPADGDRAGRHGLLAGGAEVADPSPSSWRLAPPVAATPAPRADAIAVAAMAPTAERIAAGRAAGRELARAEAEIAAGAHGLAIARLALVLRKDAALAAVILSLADRLIGPAGNDHPDLAAIHLLRGDAYRVLGRDVEAVAAWDASMRALEAHHPYKEPE